MPGFDRRGFCRDISRYHRLWTRWTIARRSVRSKNSYCGNRGCAARAVPNLHHADQNSLVHCHCHASDFCNTDHDRFGDDDTVENAGASFDSNCPEAFLRSYGDLDADPVSNPCRDPRVQQHAGLLPDFHAAAQSECNVRSANVDPANENSGYPYEYEALLHAATFPDTSPDFYSAA
jgi:hypothetical protein